MITAGGTKHACARCGAKRTSEEMVYSRFTRNRYCRNLATCEKRAARRRTHA